MTVKQTELLGVRKRGKPNWRKPEDYDSLNGLTPSQRAWEFIRRNPKYIEEWRNYLDFFLALSKGSSRPWPDEICGPWKWGLRSLVYLDPDARHSNIEFAPFGGEEALTIWPPAKKKGRRFQIRGYLGGSKDGRVILEFDINRSINKQLETAEKTLRRLRRNSKKRGNEMAGVNRLRYGKEDNDGWKLLLRILDADAEVPKPKDKEIAFELFPDEKSPKKSAEIKKVRDLRKTAQRYLTHDYRFIPHSEK